MLQTIFQQYGKKLNSEHQQLVDAWYDAYDRDAGVELTDAEAAGIEAAMWQRLYPVVMEVPRQRRIWWPYAAAAAVVAAILTISLWPAQPQALSVHYLTYTTGAGEQKQLRLPDGSAVTLQAGSRVVLDERFDRPQREIFMQAGEVSFDVAADQQRAFVVHTGRLDVKVLGTSFHIRSLSGVRRQEVIVQQGKVQVTQADKVLGTLHAGNRLVYDTLTGQAQLLHCDSLTGNRIAQGWLVFENTSFADLKVWLMARYGVTVEDPQHKLDKASLTTMFPPQTIATDIIEVLCAINHARYTINRNLITIR